MLSNISAMQTSSISAGFLVSPWSQLHSQTNICSLFHLFSSHKEKKITLHFVMYDLFISHLNRSVTYNNSLKQVIIFLRFSNVRITTDYFFILHKIWIFICIFLNINFETYFFLLKKNRDLDNSKSTFVLSQQAHKYVLWMWNFLLFSEEEREQIMLTYTLITCF